MGGRQRAVFLTAVLLSATLLLADSRMARVEVALAARMKKHHVPGAGIAVIDNGRIVWARGYGVREAGHPAPVTGETLFQAASISKPVAAMAALHMAQYGNFSLDEDVNGKLKSWKVPDNEFTRENKVTLRGILSHSAGLTVHGFRGYALGEQAPTLLQLLDGLPPANSAPVRVDIPPGSKWRYSGGGYSVMQLLLEDVARLPFPQLAQKMVLGRIRMHHSTFEQPLPGELRAQAASGHDANGALIRGQWFTHPEMAAAGLWTTPGDLALLIIEVQTSLHGRSNRVLSRDMTSQMLTRQAGDYGLGFRLDGKGRSLRFSHSGTNVGFECLLVAFAEAGKGAVVMTNAERGGQLAGEILSMIAAEYSWPE